MRPVRELSRKKFRVTFEDEDRALFLPLTARYRLDDITTGTKQEIIGWTVIAPQTSVEITIPSDANRILNDSNRFEQRLLTVQTDYDTDNQLSTDEEYVVENLEGFT